MSVLPSPLTFKAANQLYVVTLMHPVAGVVLMPPKLVTHRHTWRQAFRVLLHTGAWQRNTSHVELTRMHDLKPGKKRVDNYFTELAASPYIFTSKAEALVQKNLWTEAIHDAPASIELSVATLAEALPHFAETLPKS